MVELASAKSKSVCEFMCETSQTAGLSRMRPDHTAPPRPQHQKWHFALPKRSGTSHWRLSMVQTRSRTSPIVEQTPLFPNDGHASARGWGHKLKTSEYVDVFKAVDPLRAMLQRVRQTAAYARPPSAAPVDSASTFATSGSSVACTPGVKKTPADSSEDRKL